ncbi:uncharacterized protein PODANS_3_9190 [Podospora anserina S mat+]|uniref:Podospora anserina S mat+ genomic DNA chromosome 3, supercontig 2 n=1 Tax=Podospora anserina (strain S / ATCC MYA-4624 / DSM 980 / FGSC 10383) TaxID=515849 RepID=B2B138_PODAN|nr:uncharacterized protein PODANS_3_9190 [Podospora anserina S mat+]CAP70861.1 unnamed protein product [Podospora anserina S mat+]CDP27455.1 Putative protein of unknown function [Podospora anserina S mat+]
MKLLPLLLLPLPAATALFNPGGHFYPLLHRASCHGNNCNRAVTGTGAHLPPPTQRSADCRSFLLTTVTPAATYVPSPSPVSIPHPTDYKSQPRTITKTVEPTPGARLLRRDELEEIEKRNEVMARQATITPTRVPSWVGGNCGSGPDEFRTGCLCFGVTGGVSTAPRRTVTVTETLDWCEE